MKKYTLFILLISMLILTLSLVSCSTNTKEDSSNSTEIKEANDIETTKNETTDNSAKEESTTDTNKTPENASSKAYFGTWAISKKVATTPISALSEDEITNYIGKTLYLSEKKMSFDGENLVNPSFEETALSDNDFISENKTSLKSIGIDSSTVKKVDVKQNANSNWISFFGTSFFVKDNNTLIVLWDGVFFELKKE